MQDTHFTCTYMYLAGGGFDEVDTFVQLSQLMVTATAVGDNLHSIQTHSNVRAARVGEGLVDMTMHHS